MLKLFSRLTYLILFLSSVQVLLQDNSTLINDNENKLNRTRILFGYSSAVRPKVSPELRNIFMNVNYRLNDFDYCTKPFKVEFAFEAGLNGVSVQEKNSNMVLIVPYLKFGPEMSLTKNLFIGVGVGAATPLPSYIAFLPYGGFNAYYLIPVDRNLFVEFESGYHTAIFSTDRPYLIYFSTGISIK